MKFPSLLYFEEVILSPLLYFSWVENNIWTFKKTPKWNKSWEANDFKYYFKITSIGFIIHFRLFLIIEGVIFPSLFILFEWMELFLKLKTENFPKVNQMKFITAPHHFPLYFLYFKEVLLSSLMKILEWHKVSKFEIFQMEFKSFSNPFSFL